MKHKPAIYALEAPSTPNLAAKLKQNKREAGSASMRAAMVHVEATS